MKTNSNSLPDINNISPSIKQNITDGEIVSNAEKEVVERFADGNNDKYGRFFLAALSAVPWFIPLSIVANLKGEFDQDGVNNALRLWIRENQDALSDLTMTVNEMLTRLDGFGAEIERRIESPEYLALIRRGFRTWNESETQEKKLMIKKLLTNAGAINLCPDDQVRLFIDWIERYHEAHFAVMKEIYQNQYISKGQIWDNIHPEGRPRDNSAEAGLFSYLMRELNTGGIIRLKRQVNNQGQTLKSKRTSSGGSNKSDVMESPFENNKKWELSELGKEFVRYVMEDVDPQIS